MIIGTAPERPMIFSLGFFDRKIVDAREPAPHQSMFVKLPVLVSIRSEPVPRIITPFVSETHRDAIAVVSPKLFDQPVVQLLRPLACKKFDDLLPAIGQFR